MEIRALRTIRTDGGNVKRGTTTSKLSDPVAKSLIKRGLAELVSDPAEAEKPEAKTHAKTKGAKSSPATGVSAPEGD